MNIFPEVNNFKLALDINLTEELKEKGVVRELIRSINSLRKEAGLIAQMLTNYCHQCKYNLQRDARSTVEARCIGSDAMTCHGMH